jgi:hypothetical protein
MQIDSRMDTTSLAALGAEAVRLLCSGNISTLASRFGYALAYGREPAAAIQEDLRSCLSELRSASLAPTLEHPAATVKYFDPNDSGLLAVVECLALAENGAGVLVELVVTGNESERHVTLEQISAAA